MENNTDILVPLFNRQNKFMKIIQIFVSVILILVPNFALAENPIRIASSPSWNAIGDGDVSSPSIDESGNWIVFGSSASNLTNTPDPDQIEDIFLKDMSSGNLRQITFGNNQSHLPTISSDGRWIAYYSRATNLDPTDQTSAEDVYLFDRKSEITKCISCVSGGSDAATYYVAPPSMSSDGKFVAFESRSTNLIDGDENNFSDVFVYDRVAENMDRISTANNGTEANGNSNHPSISDDGRLVTFHSTAENLVDDDTNNVADIFVFDRTINQIERIKNVNNSEFNNMSIHPSISGDGKFVAFESAATNWSANDTNTNFDILMWNRETKIITLGSQNSNQEIGWGWSSHPSLSRKGNYVAFTSTAQLVDEDQNYFEDVYVRSMKTGITSLISRGGQRFVGNDFSGQADISDNGSHVVFQSYADNLISSDENYWSDIFRSENSNYAPPTHRSITALNRK